MTEEQRATAVSALTAICLNESIANTDREAIKAYYAEAERMRQFIRNLADESRVYLESEE